MYHQTKFGLLTISGFWVIHKNKIANLCKPTDDVIIIPVLDFHFKSDKVGEGRAETQNLEYLENEKSFLHEIKTIFHHFLRAFFLWNEKK